MPKLPLLLKLCAIGLPMIALSGIQADCSEIPRRDIQVLRMFYDESDLIVSVARNPKPLKHVAENITVITAREIEAMNAHTVDEVLSRVPGVFVNFGGQDFGSSSMILLQGSEDRHVRVLLDGITLNSLSGGNAITNMIPVGIIDRIEIIKGPASSAWGSSLGGVINIITKPCGTTSRPEAMVSASLGEKNSQDQRGQLSGKAGPLGYYLHAERRYSEGFRVNRGYDNTSIFSKFKYSPADRFNFNIMAGYTEPDFGFGNISANDLTSSGSIRQSYAKAEAEYRFAEGWKANLSFSMMNFRFAQENDVLGIGLLGPAGDRLMDTLLDETTTGGGAMLVWEKGFNSLVLGADMDQGRLDQTIVTGPYYQSFGYPEFTLTNPDMDTWAVYVNDTLAFDPVSITLGLRHDYNEIHGGFNSPSIGLTWELAEDSLVRLACARGFSSPPLSWMSGGGLFFDGNPDLEPETVKSYQAGIESQALKYIRVKTAFFLHEIENTFVYVQGAAGPPGYRSLNMNSQGYNKRQGGEFDIETLPVGHISLHGGGSYVHMAPARDIGSDVMKSWVAGISYNGPPDLHAQLFGRYVDFDFKPLFTEKEKKEFIWDLNVRKRLKQILRLDSSVFFTVHNVFNGRQYTAEYYRNPSRWMEGGIAVEF